MSSNDPNTEIKGGDTIASLLRAIPKVVWLIAGLAIFARVLIALTTEFTNEDFYITLRYAENIAHGSGFVYNPGERVLGTTTPLYTLFLAFFASIGLPATVVGKAVNILADGALCVVVYLWLRELKYEAAGKAAAFFVAVSPLHLRWSISGMETSLVTLLGAWIWLMYFKRRYTAAYVSLGVLFLFRWDSMLLGIVLTAAIILRERKLPLREIGLFAAIIAPWLLFAYLYFGYFIPVTGMAKMTVYGWRYRSEFLPLWPKLRFRFIGTPVYSLFTVLAAAGLWTVWKQRITQLRPPLVWFVVYWISFLLSKVLLFEWYLPPTLPVYDVIVSIGLVAVSTTFLKKLPARTVNGMAFASAAGVYAYMGWLMYGVSRETQNIEKYLRIPLGQWLNANTSPSDRIFLEPIGYVGYYSKRPVLDAIGLVSPSVLPYYKPENAAPWLEIIKANLPEWCVLRPGELKHIVDGSRATGYPWEDTYENIRTVSYTPRAGREPETFIVFRLKKKQP